MEGEQEKKKISGVGWAELIHVHAVCVRTVPCSREAALNPNPPCAMQGEDRAGLLYEERLEVAERRRLLGNSMYTQGQYKEALGKYAVVRRSGLGWCRWGGQC